MVISLIEISAVLSSPSHFLDRGELVDGILVFGLGDGNIFLSSRFGVLSPTIATNASLLVIPYYCAPASRVSTVVQSLV